MIVSPAPGSTLSGPTVTFTWDPRGTPVENYGLWLGSSFGAFDLLRSGPLPGTQTSFTKTGLPIDGRTIFVRFFFKVGGVWSSGTDTQYTAAPPPPEPEIVSPAPGSTLSGPTETFSWISNGTAVENYGLWLGSSFGAFDLLRSGPLPATQTSLTKTDLPTDGRTIFARFFFKVGGVWSSGTNTQYTAFTGVTVDP